MKSTLIVLIKGTYNILLKTIKCFELIDKDQDYDFILRLCACSYIDLYKLNKFVSKLGKKKNFSGPLNVTSNGADIRYNLKKKKNLLLAQICYYQEMS